MKLSKVLKQINSIPHINAGGCGYVAKALYKHLSNKYPNQPIEILYCFNSTFLLPSEVEAIHDNEPSSCDHVMIKLRSYFIDSEGLHKLSDVEQEYDIRYSVSYLYLDDSLKLVPWNPTFNTEHTSYIYKALTGETSRNSHLFSIQ